MKLGIIGSGMIITDFLPHLKEMEGIEVKAILGTLRSKEKVEKMCADHQVPAAVFTWEELLAQDIDAIYVAVPNHMHYEYCKKGLEAGLNVIVEKPMVSNRTEAEELAALAKEKGLFLFEAITTLYLPAFAKIKEWLPQVGTVKQVICNYSQYSSRYNAFREGTVMPAFDPEKSGGAIMDINLYNIHFIMGLFGVPEDQFYLANVERGIDTSGTLVMKYPGFTAVAVGAKDSSGPMYFVIEGTDGYIQMSYPPNVMGPVKLHRNDKTEETFDDQAYFNRSACEFGRFKKAIEEKDTTFCYEMLEKSLAVARVQTAARLSAGVVFPADRR